jgi:CRP-like cAMP-binding protein
MSPNHVLSRLSPADFRLLAPHLERVDLPVRKQLEARNKRVSYIYFLESGFASVVANGSAKSCIEVRIIGREGMTGLSIVMGSDDPVENETYMQAAGEGQRLAADKLRQAIGLSATLHREMLRFAHDYLMQTSRTVVANGRSKIEERLARWLLMAEERIGAELALTQEFLSLMLGIQRSGVTTAIQELERKALITHRRGLITIIDRAALERITNGTYRRLRKV